MKIYWVVSKCEDDPAYRCFFNETKEESEYDVKFRLDQQKLDNAEYPELNDNTEWWIEEDEVESGKFGYCTNTPELKKVLAISPQCVVGSIDAVRSNFVGDDGMCGTCSRMSKKTWSDGIPCLYRV
jgi:hypothetical protein